MSTPLSPLFRPKNPLTMTILVIPPILALETFDWSDFPVVQRDPIYESSCTSCGITVNHLSDNGDDSCSSENENNNQKALHSNEDDDSLPDLNSIGSDESDLSVTTNTVTSSDSAVTTHLSDNHNKRVTFAEHVHIRRHSLVIGDHPCCSQLALELSWEHDGGEWALLEEQREDGTGRRHTNTRRRSYLERKNLLKDIGGMTDAEIRETTLRHAAPSIGDLSAMQGISL